MRRPRLLVAGLAGLLATVVTAGTAEAGTYTFSIPGASIRLVGPEAGGSPAFRLVPPATVATQSSASPGYAANAWGRAWLTLPGGAVFRTLGGTVRRGAGQVNPPGLWASVTARAGNGISVVTWVDQIRPGYTSSAWTYDGSTTRPVAVGVQLSATAAGACGTCLVALDALSGTIEDALPPSRVTLASTTASTFVRAREMPVTWTVSDTVAGPGDVRVAINGARTTQLLRTAPAANAGLLLGQRSGGSDTARGSGVVTLPEADGTYAVQALGADGVGNEATSPAVNVTLDRTPPTIEVLEAPVSWCSTGCRVRVRSADVLSGVASVTATAGGAPVTLDDVLPGPSVERAIELDPLETEGQVEVVVTTTDRAGNTAQIEVPVALDRRAPGVATATADPATRQVHVDVEDVSGLQTARATVAGRALTLGPVGVPRLGLQLYGVTVPTDGFPEALDGTGVDVELEDAAGNTATATATFRRRAVPVPVARLISKRITYGYRVLAAGRVSGAGLVDGTPIEITLEPTLADLREDLADDALRGGRFALRVKPTMNGILRAHVPGTADVQPATVTIGRVAVRPRITATFSARRLRSGLYGDIRVRGRFRPAGGPPVTLVWQAQSPRSGEWFAICRADDAIAPPRDGRFTGRCRLAGLPAEARLRLAVALRGAPWASGASRGQNLAGGRS